MTGAVKRCNKCSNTWSGCSGVTIWSLWCEWHIWWHFDIFKKNISSVFPGHGLIDCGHRASDYLRGLATSVEDAAEVARVPELHLYFGHVPFSTQMCIFAHFFKHHNVEAQGETTANFLGHVFRPSIWKFNLKSTFKSMLHYLWGEERVRWHFNTLKTNMIYDAYNHALMR